MALIHVDFMIDGVLVTRIETTVEDDDANSVVYDFALQILSEIGGEQIDGEDIEDDEDGEDEDEDEGEE